MTGVRPGWTRKDKTRSDQYDKQEKTKQQAINGAMQAMSKRGEGEINALQEARQGRQNKKTVGKGV